LLAINLSSIPLI